MLELSRSKMRRRALGAVAAGMYLISLPAMAADPGVSDKEIVIGQTISLKAGKDAYGVAAHAGMKLYFDNLNAAGGVGGRRIVLRTLDDEGKAPAAEANARKLVAEGAFVLFGSLEGGPSTAVAKVAQDSGVPLFGPMAGPPGLRRPFKSMIFPVRAEHREEFRALLTWGKTTGLKTVGFLHVDGANGLEHLGNVKRFAQELGMEVTLALPFKADTNDATLDAFVKQIGEAKPDLFFNHGSASLYEKLVAKSKTAGVKTVFMAVNSGSSQIAQGLGPMANGMVFAQVVPSPWERKREIAREYQDAVRKADPNAMFSYGGMEGYLTAKALVVALRGAGRDLSRASLVRWLDNASFDLGGVRVQYSPDERTGSRFVDLSMISRDGRFIH